MALIRQASRLVALTVVFALVLFGSAGTPRWRAGWAFLAVTAALTTAYVLVVARFHPDLAQERTAPPPDAKQWDKPLVAAVAIVGPLVTAATAGLDRRFGWTAPLPAPAKAAGLLVIALAGALTCFAVARNPFFSSLVRIQSDRGHTVVQAGPYAVVRHPGYAASLLHMLATPLALGALAAYVPVSVLVVLTFVRTRLEDRTLQDELEGYAAYASHVRYRLVPGLW